ncbi:MAG: phospholipase [Candidatus Methanomethylicota archaeon]|uniref:Phospholipase n=1 Tax=Thermoproteota archaeon TaxID=2056631 RepID=A0A497EJK9_9CREN|nr:MAG: phospholipase [Candidatus Verstraetearchaeota archaeon]
MRAKLGVVLLVIGVIIGIFTSYGVKSQEIAVSITKTVTSVETISTTHKITYTVTTTVTVSSSYFEELLEDKEYYKTLLDVIKRANKSVYVAMYVIKYDPREGLEEDPVNMILYELCKLKSKGLDIKVLVDDTTYKSYYETIEYLKDCGIDIKLKPKEISRAHLKVVIIDGKYLFVGSHNRTESALWFNKEITVLTTDPKLISEALDYFNDLWANGESI